ncbi:protein broad-minded-like, partial [Aphidius gifuensis]
NDNDDDHEIDTNVKNSFEYFESSNDDDDDDDDVGDDDWNKSDIHFNKNIHERNFSTILDKISIDKPVHVRLAGFETLSKIEFINNCNNETFELLLKSLRDGISDDKKPIFEASLKIHSKYSDSSRSHDIYTNLITSLKNEYNIKKNYDNLPNLNTGVNFKIYLHEKLIRLLYLIIMYQREILKITRSTDRTIDEMIEQFIDILTWKNIINQNNKIMSILNLVSIIDPRGIWCKKLIHSMTTRKSLMLSISKIPNIIDIIFNTVKIGLKDCHQSQIAYSITDETIYVSGNCGNTSSVFISGETVETITFLHCLNIASQICIYYPNNKTSDITIDSSALLIPSTNDFAIDLINFLNSLAVSTEAKSIYNESFEALKLMLQQQYIQCDLKLFQASILPLINKPSKININNNLTASHTIDIIDFILDSKDGIIFFSTPYLPETNQSVILKNSTNNNIQIKEKKIIPACCFLQHASDLLRQPLVVMNVNHILRVLDVIGKLCQVLPNLELIAQTIEDYFYPSIDYFYSKIDKYAVIHENKTQNIDSAVKKMLMKISSWPLGIWLLSGHELIFEELVRASINPLRYSWKSNDIVSFVISSSFFDQAFKIIADLVPHTLSMFLNEVCCNIEDIQLFFDPWNSENVEKFIHVLSLVSLSTKCFMVFMLDNEKEESNSSDESIDHPQSFCQLIEYSLIDDSPYHYFSLLSLEVMIWNLDILVYLLHAYDLQSKLLDLQEASQLEVTKYIDKNKDDDNNEEYEEEQKIDIDETHVVYVVDECSSLRHKILCKSYYVRQKLDKPMKSIEKNMIFSSFPPPEMDDEWQRPRSITDHSELDDELSNIIPGLRDSSWIVQMKKAHENSPQPMKHTTLINLLEQMKQAISTVEWVDIFIWKDSSYTYYWLPEEDYGLDLAIRYFEDQCKNTGDQFVAKKHLKHVFETLHGFINYEKPDTYEAFDWFVSTIFVICNGQIDTCKEFVRNFVHYPSAMYMWRELGNAIDNLNNEKLITQFLLCQHIETVVNQELPNACYVLKSNYGLQWWIICNQLLGQCFWGILEWSEILHFFSICIMNPPDYIVYYCVSLLKYCEPLIMQDVIEKKSWPENLDLSGYHCHEHMNFIDRLEKKYQNNILPSLTGRKVNSLDKETDEFM